MTNSGKKKLSDGADGEIPSGKNFQFGIIVSTWNEEITQALLNGCKDTLLNHEVDSRNIITVEVPGSFELPSASQLLLESKEMDAVICLGCIIKGETKHDDYISNAVAQGIMIVSIDYSTPIIFGVLTTNDHQQAIDRSGGKYGNKGIEAALTALKMASLRQKLI